MTPIDELDTIIIINNKIERIRFNRIPLNAVGTGDLFTSFMASQLTLGNDISESVKLASRFIYELLNLLKGSNNINIPSKAILNTALNILYKK